MTGLIIAALLVSMICVVGGVVLFSILPVLLAGLSVFALILMMLVVAVMVLPYFITLDDLKPDVLNLVKERTGREITIGGPIGFTLWPVLGLRLTDISIGNPPDFPDPIMLSAQELSVGVTLSSLVSRRLDLRELRLAGAQINLSLNEQGEGNWVFSAPQHKDGSVPDAATAEADAEANAEAEAKTSSESTKDAVTPDSTATASPSLSLDRINIGRVEIVDTNLGYDFPDGHGLDLMDIDLSLTVPDAGQKPAFLNAQATYNGRPIAIDMKLEHPHAVLTQGTSPVHLSLTPAYGNSLTLEGELGAEKFDGTAQIDIDSVEGIIGLLGGSFSSPLRTVSGSAKLVADKKLLQLSDISLEIDNLALSGKASLRDMKKIDAMLDIGMIDLAPWLAAGKNADPLPPALLDDYSASALPKRNRNMVTFRETPPDLSFLSDYSADITAKLAGVRLNELAMGETTLSLKMGGGKLAAGLSPAALAEGTLKASATLNRSAFSFAGAISNAQIEPLFIALTGKDRLRGKGSATLNLSGPLSTPFAFGRTIGGSGSFTLRDGALKGINIPAVIRQGQALLAQNNPTEPANDNASPSAGTNDTNTASPPTDETDFTEMSGTFTLDRGIVSNSDLQMLSPLLRVTGMGSADIVKQTIDYRLNPSLVADLQGQGGRFQRRGLTIPVLISGTFEKPVYRPDLRGLVENNLQMIEDATKAIPSGEINAKDIREGAKDVLKGLLGQ